MVVWDYYSPFPDSVVGGAFGNVATNIHSVFKATRYAPDYIGIVNLGLSLDGQSGSEGLSQQ
jgi:hypothetical protein